MTRIAVFILALLAATVGLGSFALAQVREPRPPARQAPAAGDVRFIAVDIFVDSGPRSLAAYQVEVAIAAAGGVARLVGVEGGEHPAFADPPYYDPIALHAAHDLERIVVAALNTTAELPRGRFCAARLHVQIPAGAQPRIEARLVAAGGAEADRLEATVEARLAEPPAPAPQPRQNEGEGP